MNNKLMKMMPMISCKKASTLMSESMDRHLSIKEVLSLKMHLLLCMACKQVLKQLKGLRRLMRVYRDSFVSNKTKSSFLSQRAKDKIKQRLMGS